MTLDPALCRHGRIGDFRAHAAPRLGAAVETRNGRVAVDPAGNRLAASARAAGSARWRRSRPGPAAAGPGGRPPAAAGRRALVGGAWPGRRLYVGELTSFPHPPGRVRVWRVVPGRDPVVYATGLTAVTGLSWGPGDRLHVHQAGSGPVRVSG